MRVDPKQGFYIIFVVQSCAVFLLSKLDCNLCYAITMKCDSFPAMPHYAMPSYYMLDYGAILCFVMLRYASGYWQLS